jgi:hypothetical protein
LHPYGLLLAVDQIRSGHLHPQPGPIGSRETTRRRAAPEFDGSTGNSHFGVTMDGTITMDLRLVVFNLIYRDVVLRALLLNYADRVEHGDASDGTTNETCFLVLRWTAHGQLRTPASSEVLTAHVHVPWHSNEDSYLDFVVQRLRAALAAGAGNGPITIRCVGASPEVMHSGIDTIFKTSTFEIVPAPPPRRRVTTLKLAPWTGYVDLDAARLIAPSSGAPSMN